MVSDVEQALYRWMACVNVFETWAYGKFDRDAIELAIPYALSELKHECGKLMPYIDVLGLAKEASIRQRRAENLELEGMPTGDLK